MDAWGFWSKLIYIDLYFGSTEAAAASSGTKISGVPTPGKVFQWD